MGNQSNYTQDDGSFYPNGNLIISINLHDSPDYEFSRHGDSFDIISNHAIHLGEYFSSINIQFNSINNEQLTLQHKSTNKSEYQKEYENHGIHKVGKHICNISVKIPKDLCEESI